MFNNIEKHDSCVRVEITTTKFTIAVHATDTLLVETSRQT
jgi:hypothetical protein